MSLQRQRETVGWIRPASVAFWLPSGLLLVVLAPVAAEDSGGMFVLVEDFTVHGPDDAVVSGKMEHV